VCHQAVGVECEIMSGFTGTLNPQQREAATHLHGPLLILAGAGTGKTRVITARIAHMVNEGIDPKHILAVTFTNKAANEMRERVNGMVRDGLGKKIGVGTFHAFCARLLREFAEHVGYKKNFVIYSQAEQESLMKQVLKTLLSSDESMDAGVMLSRISKSKNDGASLGDPQESTEGAIMDRYQGEMRGRNVMDFDDLLMLGVQLLESSAEVRREVQARHRYVMVDEFQDTNSLQMRLLKALVPAPFNVCVVGDDDQSIYGWRGAEITNITQFENFFPNPHVVKLEENYRSTTPILHTANSLIKNNAGRRPKNLWSRMERGENVKLVITADEKEEAEMVTKEVEATHYRDKRDWEDFAVLFRTNDQSRVLEQAFRQRRIPYRVVGARSFFDRREVKDLVAYLKVFTNPHSDIDLLRILNVPARGIAPSIAELARERSMERHHSVWVALCDPDWQRQIPEKARAAVRGFVSLINKYHAAAVKDGTKLATMGEMLLAETEYLAWLKKGAKTPEDTVRWEMGVNEMLKSLATYDEKNRSDGLTGYLDEICLDDEREDKDDIEKKKGVCLITMHASKGLEFPIVYLPGLEQGILPHRRSYEEGRVDEERRLFYVGITRAKQRLTISHTRNRIKWGQKQTSLPSPFLKELDPKFIEEVDYSRHMNESVTQEENTHFFAGLRAMLEDG
jgi:DNA helicase-2/ATP-dependent DNA helicase PcrA